MFRKEGVVRYLVKVNNEGSGCLRYVSFDQERMRFTNLEGGKTNITIENGRHCYIDDDRKRFLVYEYEDHDESLLKACELIFKNGVNLDSKEGFIDHFHRNINEAHYHAINIFYKNYFELKSNCGKEGEIDSSVIKDLFKQWIVHKPCDRYHLFGKILAEAKK